MRPRKFVGPNEGVDLVFANAAYQWVPNHLNAMRRVVEKLPAGSILTVQMPDNTREPSHAAMREVARRSGITADARTDLPNIETYYDALAALCSRLEIWHIVYSHVMPNARDIVEWFRGSALRPFLAGLDAERAQEFLDA